MKKETSAKEAISLDESKRLIDLEDRIKQGVKTFVEVGIALDEIRVARLYRAEFKTFQDYCQTRWGFTKSRAFQLIDSAVMVRALPEGLSTTVDTERAARALKKVKSGGSKTPEMRRVNTLLKKAVKKKIKVTARDIQTAAKKPPSRGGLASDAIRAQRGGTDNGHPKTVMLGEASLDIVHDTYPITPAEFQKALDLLEARIPEDGTHEKFGVILNNAANRQMNWGKKSSASAYV